MTPGGAFYHEKELWPSYIEAPRNLFCRVCLTICFAIKFCYIITSTLFQCPSMMMVQANMSKQPPTINHASEKIASELGRVLLVNFPSRWSLSLSFALCVDPQHHSNRAMYSNVIGHCCHHLNYRRLVHNHQTMTGGALGVRKRLKIWRKNLEHALISLYLISPKLRAALGKLTEPWFKGGQ